MGEHRGSIESLLDELKEAFGDTPCPKDEEILKEGMGEVEYCGNPTAGLSGVRWMDLPARCYSKEKDFYFWPWLIDLTSVAYHYYLPGYLLITLENYDKAHVSQVISSLIPGDYMNAVEPLERFSRFTLKQKRFIKKYLEYMIQEHKKEVIEGTAEEAEKALKQYWGKY